MAYIKGNHVHVLSYNAGVLGVYENRTEALKDKVEYQSLGYKGLKIEEHLIG